MRIITDSKLPEDKKDPDESTIYQLYKHFATDAEVAELAEITLKNNLMPVLYTNFQYEPSNKCYQAVGFELLNTIYTYSVKKIA